MGWCRLLGADLIGLQAFVSLDDDKGHWLAIVQASSASALDIAEVNEKIFTIFSGNKAVALFRIEPLNCAVFVILIVEVVLVRCIKVLLIFIRIIIEID